MHAVTFPTMAAIVPPPNASGIPLPDPQVPATYEDIASARKYLEDLAWTRGQSLGNRRFRLMTDSSTANPAHQAPATMDIIGRAEAYRSSLVFTVEGRAAPPWLQELVDIIRDDHNTLQNVQANLSTLQANFNMLQANLNMLQANFDTLRADVTGSLAQLIQKSNEEPIILANSRAANREQLYNPTQLQAGWAAPLARPRSRDDLCSMSGRFSFLMHSITHLCNCFSPRLHDSSHCIRIATSSSWHYSCRTSSSNCKEDRCRHRRPNIEALGNKKLLPALYKYIKDTNRFEDNYGNLTHVEVTDYRYAQQPNTSIDNILYFYFILFYLFFSLFLSLSRSVSLPFLLIHYHLHSRQ